MSKTLILSILSSASKPTRAIMQNNNRTLFLLIGAVILALAALFYWQYRSMQPLFDWRDSWVKTSYSEGSDQPYGTQILHQLLKGYFPDHQLVDVRRDLTEELPLKTKTPATYVCVGEGIYWDSLSTAHLLAFAKAGNTVLLSTKTIPFDLMFHLYYRECDDAEWNDYEMQPFTEVSASLGAPELAGETRLHYARQNKPEPYRWSYIESDFFCDSLPQQPLGYLNDSLINFAVFPCGEGRFLLHTTPIAFSNYHLLHTGPRQYVEKVLSYLPEGDLYWDTYSRVPEMIARRRNGRNAFARQLPAEHPLAYVLQQPSLAWAWYLLLALAGLFLVFRGKRRQRPIPVLPVVENSSYEFINTIANLHFREKNYQNLCVQNMRLFLAQIRDRYGLVAQLDADTLKPRMDKQFPERLAQVAGVPLQQVQNIFTRYSAAVQYDPTEDMMIDLHLALEDFFKKAK